MPVTSRTPVRPPPARARTVGLPRPDPRGRCTNPADRGGPASRRAGCGAWGSVPRLSWITWATRGGWIGGGGGAGASGRSSFGQGRRRPPPPLVRPLPSSSLAAVAGIRGWHQTPAQLCALFPVTAQKFRSRTSGSNPNTGALRPAPENPQDRGTSGLRRPSRTDTSHKFYFPFALEVLSGSRSTPARLVLLPALPRQRYESVPGKGYFGTFEKLMRFQ